MSNFHKSKGKEKDKFITILTKYLLSSLHNFSGKSFKGFGKKKIQVVVSLLSFAMALGMLPIMSFATSAESSTIVSSVKFIQSAAGGMHNLLLDKNGNVWAFGLNSHGQLGNTTNNGTSTANSSPTKITAEGLGKVTAIAAGYTHTLLLDQNGVAWAFGSNYYGQLGNATNSTTDTANPIPTKITAEGLGKVTAIAAGIYHTLLLDENGAAWAFGLNSYGQLGISKNSGTTSANPTPTKVSTAGFGKVTAIAAGGMHTLLLDENGEAWAFGSNIYGQLGVSIYSLNNFIYTPTQLRYEQLGKVTAIAAGNYHTLLLNENGETWAFGSNYYGQLGISKNSGTTTANPTPTMVPPAGFGKVTAIAAGNYHTLLLDENGAAWAFGLNSYGQLGNANNNRTSTANPIPTKITGAELGKVTTITAGNDNTLLLNENAETWTFGFNYYGQLGNATNSATPNPNPTPTKVTIEELGINPLAVDVSMAHGAAIRLNQQNGIRYYTTVDAEKISSLKAEGATVEMGTLIAPADLLGTDELTFNLDFSKYIDVKYIADEYFENENTFVGSIVDIKEENTDYSTTSGNITRNFVGRGYVKVTKNGETLISYADYAGSNITNNSRSLAYIATALKGDTPSYDALSDTLKLLINGWSNSKK